MTARPRRPADQALLYHFTHIDNVASILRADALSADSAVADELVTDVGDAGIKRGRRTRQVPTGPGGVVADYVPFYFAPKSPMMCRIAYDHRDGIAHRYPDGDDPLVYLVTSVDRLATASHWVATDGNAAAVVTRFSTRLEDLTTLVDWPLMEQRDWYNTTEDPDRMSRRMAEFLVHGRCPLAVLHGFAVRTSERQDELRTILEAAGRSDYINVRPDWYYGYRQTGGGENADRDR